MKSLKALINFSTGELWSTREGKPVMILRVDYDSVLPVLVYRDDGDPYSVGLDGKHHPNNNLDLIKYIGEEE